MNCFNRYAVFFIVFLWVNLRYMNKMILIFTLFSLDVLTSTAQEITYSPIVKKDTKGMYFEIIGKVDNHFLVYKNVSRHHYITTYDEAMNVVDNHSLDAIPEKIINIDFINRKDYTIIIYQFQKNSIVYCNALKFSGNAKIIGEPIGMDTTEISYFSDNTIYTTSFSEDKTKILIAKQNAKNNKIEIATKLFDQDFNLLEASKNTFPYNSRKENFSDCYVDNNGNFLYTKETQKNANGFVNKLEVFVHKRGTDTNNVFLLPLDNKFVDESFIKIDNLNHSYIINAFFFNENRGHVQGIFTARIPTIADSLSTSNFNLFSDAIRDGLNGEGNSNDNLDDLKPQNIILKKDGGFLLISESVYTQTRSTDNILNKNFYYNGFPNSYDYYGYNSYGNANRYWNNYNQNEIKRYFYNDIVVANIDSSLHMNWNNIIHKKQYDVDNDNFISYAILNSGREVHFLFIEKDNKKDIISNNSIFSTGELKRYPTLKSNENGYEFMQKLGKQVGIDQMLIPYVYFGNIGFAKIDF